MMDATGFIETLLDDPEDATTLLVLADFLEDQGDSRAELVRLQGQLAQWDPDHHKRADLQRRERELCQQLAGTWFGPLGTFCRSWRIGGGLAHVTIDARRFVGKRFGTQANAWLTQAWVKTVRLHRPVDHMARLIDTPALSGVRALDLSGGGLDDSQLEALLDSPNLSRLRELDLSNNQLSDDAVQMLAESSHLGQLRTLSLRNNRLSGRAVDYFQKTLESTGLRWLDLHGNALVRDDVEMLTAWHRERVPSRYFFGPLGMVFRLIPAGTFPMGSPDGEADRLGDEGPVHPVTIRRPYYLGIFPVTQQQYLWLTGDNPSNYRAGNGGGFSHPVESMPWESAAAFCRQMSELPSEKEAGRVYRLPSEAEWEHACRSGNALSLPFAWGSTLSSVEANFNGAAPYQTPAGPSLGRTTPVGSYPPTPWGLYDMHGNVWEWCADWFQDNYYHHSTSVDPKGPKSGRDGYRVLRGGAYYDPGRYCRCAVRGRNESNNQHDGLGFRVLLEIR